MYAVQKHSTVGVLYIHFKEKGKREGKIAIEVHHNKTCLHTKQKGMGQKYIVGQEKKIGDSICQPHPPVPLGPYPVGLLHGSLGDLH